MHHKKSIAVFFVVILSTFANAQTHFNKKHFLQPDTIYNPHRAAIVIIGTSNVYLTSMVGLYALWYRGYPSSGFHTFNDAEEWNQMDKIGHIGSAYYLSRWSNNLVAWTGTDKKKSARIGAGMGLIYQTIIEVMDGFSSQWGFSWSDVGANSAGSLLFLSQQLAWKEQRIQFKFSFHTTQYAKYRPALLGENFSQHIFKDYNGQTYWLSANIYSFLSYSSHFPKWLNISLGYGAEGMTGANQNPFIINGNPIPSFQRYRQFYLAPDIDLTKIKLRSPLLKTIFQTIGFIKFPAPAIEYNTKGKIIFRAFYF